MKTSVPLLLSFKIRLLYFLFLIIIPVALFGSDDPIKWGKLLAEDITLAVFKPEPDAPAVILCDFGTTIVGSRTIYTRHVRLKILKPEGLKYAIIEIPYSDYNKYDEVKMIKAQVFSPMEGKKMEVTKFTASDFEKKRINEKMSLLSLNIPNVKPGCIIEYTYEIASLDFIKPHDWVFQQTLPVLWSEFRFATSSSNKYLVSFSHGKPLENDQKVEYSNRIKWLIENKAMVSRAELSKNDNVLFETSDHSFKSIFVNGTSRRFVMTGIHSAPMGPFVNTMVDYKPHIDIHLFESLGNGRNAHNPMFMAMDPMFQYSPMNYRERNNMSSGYLRYQLETWQKFSENMLKNDQFGLQLVKYPGFKPEIPETASDLQKIKIIHASVCNNMPWNGEYNVYFSSTSQKEKTTSFSSGEINLTLVNLLKREGLNASPVLVKTKNKGLVQTIYAEKNQFNHIVALVQAENEQFLVDATNPLRPFQYIDQLALNTPGWLLLREGSGFVNLDPMFLSQMLITTSFNDSLDENHAEIEISLTGYLALHVRELLLTDTSNALPYIKNICNAFSITKAEVFNKEDIYKPLILKADAKMNALNEMTTGIPFPQEFTKNIFKNYSQSIPVDFGFPLEITSIIKSNKHLFNSKEAAISFQDNLLKFSNELIENEESSQYIISLRIQQSKYDRNQFPALKLFFQSVSDNFMKR